MLSHTSTPWAPWYVVPADHKWFTRLATAAVLVTALRAINPRYPAPDPAAEGSDGTGRGRAGGRTRRFRGNASVTASSTPYSVPRRNRRPGRTGTDWAGVIQ